MKHYIVVMRDTNLWLVGPFQSQYEAGIWGLDQNKDDDPRWQTIQLPVGDSSQAGWKIKVLAPMDGAMNGEDSGDA